MLLYYLLLAVPMVFYIYLLLAYLISLWYSTIFYWSTGYPFGTLLCSYWLTGYPYDTLLSSASPLAVNMVLYDHLLAHPLFLLYSTIFYWHIGYLYDITLSFSDPHAIPLVLFYLLLAHLLRKASPAEVLLTNSVRKKSGPCPWTMSREPMDSVDIVQSAWTLSRVSWTMSIL